MRRSRGQVVLTGIYVLLALNAWAQVIAVPLGSSEDPLALTGLQMLIGAAGAAVAWGSWASARWVPAAALVHGAVTAGMLLALLPLLDLGSEARGGLWLGAAVVLLFAAGSAWYLRRAIRRAHLPSIRQITLG